MNGTLQTVDSQKSDKITAKMIRQLQQTASDNQQPKVAAQNRQDETITTQNISLSIFLEILTLERFDTSYLQYIWTLLIISVLSLSNSLTQAFLYADYELL